MSSASGSKPQAGALIAAVKAGDEALVRSLLDAGADVNEQDAETLNTPLHWVAYYGATDIAELLLSRGANTEAQDRNGMTPLHDAVAFASPKIVTLLLGRGASVNAPNTAGDTPLHLAAMFNETSAIAESLIEAGAVLDVKNEDEQTPLYCAADESRLETTALLFALRANIDDAIHALLCRNFPSEELKTAVEKLQTHPLVTARALKDRRMASIARILDRCILDPTSGAPSTNTSGGSGSHGGGRHASRKRKTTRRRRRASRSSRKH